MVEKQLLMGNEAIARGSIEAGVRIVTGYPGTPASEIITSHMGYPNIHVEWSANEKVALEIAVGASLAGQRAIAAMKHNGTNVATDFLMHLNFTGVRGGLVLVSADDPGGNSSQNEEDSRIITHLYAQLPLYDPSSPMEAKQMIKAAFELSEQIELCTILRPVMRVCHARELVTIEPKSERDRPPDFFDDRSRYVMSAVVDKTANGLMRPVVRHHWLNEKNKQLLDIAESSPFNWIESGEGNVGLIGCGIGYSYIKEAERILECNFPILKLATLPIPRKKVLAFAQQVDTLIVFEEIKPIVERMIKEVLFDEGMQVRVLGRSSFIPCEGELSLKVIFNALNELIPIVPRVIDVQPALDMSLPLRTRTQCVGCSYRGLLSALKRVVKRHNGIVTGDIGCHDMGSFPPMELQSTIYCMGSSIPIASGLAFSGIQRPIFAIMGDSTFFHNGIIGLINAIYQGAKLVTVICDNGTTAMTGFQPHPGSDQSLGDKQAVPINIEDLVIAMGAHVTKVDPYKIEEVETALEKAVSMQGVSVIISSAPCYLLSHRVGQKLFTERPVKVDQELCINCMLCINDFGCPAIQLQNDSIVIDEKSCVQCGMCIDVCEIGAIK